MKSEADHHADALRVQACISQDSTARWCINRTVADSSTSPSVCFLFNTAIDMTRDPHYKKDCTVLDLTVFNCVIRVDESELIAVVEPSVTMEELYYATVASGLLPAVLPEFRKITVGGAVTGAGLESSSHHYGHFHTACAWADVLVGDGRVLRCSATQYADLWHALPGSYGSLGVVLLTAVRLVRWQPFVRLHYQQFSSLELALTGMRYDAHTRRLFVAVDERCVSALFCLSVWVQAASGPGTAAGLY